MDNFKNRCTLLNEGYQLLVAFNTILFALFFLFSSQPLKAKNNSTTIVANEIPSQNFSLKNSYLPHLEIGGVKFLNQSSTAAGIYELFLPLLQKDNQLFFTDLKLFDRSGSQTEGNFHLGYRQLYQETKQMFGVYGSYDLKRTSEKNITKQLTFGLEYWKNRLFIGGNIYKPIGKTKKFIGAIQTDSSINRNIINKQKTTAIILSQNAEKALGGADAEVGYAVTDNLTSYIGGYYFTANNVATVAGPKVRITYDYLKPTGKILGILDGVSIEAGVEHDKPRGTSGYIGIKLKIAMTAAERNTNIQGFARHMTELVRRDYDIVMQKTKTPEVIQTTVKTEELSKEDFKDYLNITNQETEEEFAEKELIFLDSLNKNNSPANTTIIDQYKDWINEIKTEIYPKTAIPSKETIKNNLNITNQTTTALIPLNSSDKAPTKATILNTLKEWINGISKKIYPIKTESYYPQLGVLTAISFVKNTIKDLVKRTMNISPYPVPISAFIPTLNTQATKTTIYATGIKPLENIPSDFKNLLNAATKVGAAKFLEFVNVQKLFTKVTNKKYWFGLVKDKASRKPYSATLIITNAAADSLGEVIFTNLAPKIGAYLPTKVSDTIKDNKAWLEAGGKGLIKTAMLMTTSYDPFTWGELINNIAFEINLGIGECATKASWYPSYLK